MSQQAAANNILLTRPSTMAVIQKKPKLCTMYVTSAAHTTPQATNRPESFDDDMDESKVKMVAMCWLVS